jgi:hypothetical protein
MGPDVGVAVALETGGWFELALFKVAVYVAGAPGAMIECVWAPPSDQDEKTYGVPPIDWFGALNEFVDLTITVRVNGAVPENVPTVSWAPDGLDWNVRPTVCGLRSTDADAERPFASVAVSWSSR